MRTLVTLVTLAALAACSDSPTKPADPGGERPTVSAVNVSSPIGSIIPVGWQVTLEAVALTSQGIPLQADVTWSSADPDVATVTSSGTVRGVAAGATVITAEAGNVRGSLDLTAAAADLVATEGLLADPLAEGLISALDPATQEAVRSAWAACGEGSTSGNLSQLQNCVADARVALASPATAHRPTATLVGLFVDWIERHLNLD